MTLSDSDNPVCALCFHVFERRRTLLKGRVWRVVFDWVGSGGVVWIDGFFFFVCSCLCSAFRSCSESDSKGSYSLF